LSARLADNHFVEGVIMHIEPYLNFDGRCDEAIEFYKSAIGAEVKMLMRFKDFPGERPPGGFSPGTENKVMHANLRIGDSTVLVSDGRCQGKSKFEGITLSLSVANVAEADRFFAALGDGGKVHMPLDKTFFSPRFGMLADRFGVMWMVIVQ
jgi:PhnB protein